MKKNLYRQFLLPLLAFLICVPIAFSQSDTGSITGEVTDPSGAVITGASVLVHNLDTGVDTPRQRMRPVCIESTFSPSDTIR